MPEIKPRTLLVIAALLLLPAAAAASNHIVSTGPSAFCHVTDGAFTDCDPGGGAEEWSDIDFLPGLGASAGTTVYTDQSFSPQRLLLMYVLDSHTEPLPVDSFFDIEFHVVIDGNFAIYDVQCFGDGSHVVLQDGVDVTDEATTVDCGVGFDGRVLVELEIDTLVTYSPDVPLFWSTAAPPPGDRCPPDDPDCEPPCQPGTPGCECPPEDPTCCPPEDPACCPTGDCPPPSAPQAAPDGFIETSSTVVIASSDGTTQVVALPPGGVVPGQLCDKKTGTGFLVDLIGTTTARNHGQFMKQVRRRAHYALNSMVGFGQITEQEAHKLQGCIVSVLAKRK